MTATVIDGDAIAAALSDKVRHELGVARASGATPGLATVLVGGDYAAHAYERRLQRTAEDLGCSFTAEHLEDGASQADVLATVGKLGADPRVTGILVLRPLPSHVSEVALYSILDQAKDIEGVHPANAGLMAQGTPRYVPSTPASCFYLLDHHAASLGVDPAEYLRGRTVVVVGRSHNVGRPATWLALERGATVLNADEHTFAAGQLPHYVREAEILIVAVGRAGLITADMVSDGAVVIDVGINPVKDPVTGKVRLVGDVDPAVAERASAITPVPGGVGPVTDVWLVRNAVIAAIAQQTNLPVSPWAGPVVV